MLNTFSIDDMSHGKIGVCINLYTYMVIRCILMVDNVPGIVFTEFSHLLGGQG